MQHYYEPILQLNLKENKKKKIKEDNKHIGKIYNIIIKNYSTYFPER